MFTGIVEEMGRVSALVHQKNLSVLSLSARKVLSGTKLGDSIAVNGVCLTVTKKKASVLEFDLMKETLSTSSLSQLRVGSSVNLERALKVGGRFSGHIVTGHIDGICRLKKIIKTKNFVELQLSVSKDLKKFLVPKGSVCLDGVSLTVGKVAKDFFSVYLIPFTLKVTTLGKAKVGDSINTEVDILAKYILNNKI